MKTLTSLFIVAFVLLSTFSFSQEKSVFESASLAASADGLPAVQLSWKKGNENTAYYLVERSNDGKDFKQVALVFTWEDSRYTAYNYRDKGFAAAGDALYYRIGIVSDQKELSYLPVKKVEFSSAALHPASQTLAQTLTSSEK